jgi:hypothetical protein
MQITKPKIYREAGQTFKIIRLQQKRKFYSQNSVAVIQKKPLKRRKID